MQGILLKALSGLNNPGIKSVPVEGGALAALIALGILGIFFILIFLIMLYVYTSLTLMIIGKKMKYENSWLAWIPIANISMILQLGGFHWAWAFLVLIPILGWIPLFILGVISWWRIFESNNYHGAFSLLLVAQIIPKIGFLAFIAFLVMLGILAWGKEDKIEGIKKKRSPQKTTKKKVVRHSVYPNTLKKGTRVRSSKAKKKTKKNDNFISSLFFIF